MVNVIQNYTKGLSNITTPDEFLTVMNTNLRNLPGTLFVFTVFLITFLLLKNTSSTKQAFAASSFTSTLIAWLLWIINWTSTTIFVLFIVITIISVISLFVTKE